MVGETDDRDFAERERQAAEDRAFELNPHGTGVDPDIDLNYDYDYDASPELTDADYQPNNSFSDDFTNYGGADPYANQFGQNDDEGENEDDADEETKRRRQADSGEFIEDWDGDEAETDGEDGEVGREAKGEKTDGETADTDEDQYANETPKQRAKREAKEAKATQQAEYQNLKVKWKKGDPIDIKVLGSVWGQCRKINQVRPLTEAVNRSLEAALIASGPNLMIKLNKYIQSVQEQDNDLLGSLLKLAQSDGKRLAVTTGAIVESIFDQQWMQVLLLATLPKTLEGLIAAAPVQAALQALFTVAVPIINGTAKKQSKGK